MKSSALIRSPLNYTGGKFKILKDIIPLFPTKINTFVDLFAGGFNVGVNIDAKHIIANDQLTYLIELYHFFQHTSWEKLEGRIEAKIRQFELSDQNQEGYLRLREEYNQRRNSLDLFLLTCYSFNHQIRFNGKHQFNTPFGRDRSCYNSSIRRNLQEFLLALQKKDITFTNNDFLAVDLHNLAEGDYVYCDPPYLITTGSYNDGKRGFKDWTETEERQLLDLLDGLARRNILFGLSNVFEHKGERNDLLCEWSHKYEIHFIDKKYSNCSYHFKDRATKTVEVFITNYKAQNLPCNSQPMLF